MGNAIVQMQRRNGKNQYFIVVPYTDFTPPFIAVCRFSSAAGRMGYSGSRQEHEICG